MIRPYQQGQLDALCGIYSVINAARLIMGREIDEDESKQLLSKCFTVIESRAKLPYVITEGMGIRMIGYLLQDVICSSYPIESNKPFRTKHNISTEHYWCSIKSFLNHGNNNAVILGFESRTWGHWSVVHTATDNTFSLFDSFSKKRLARRHCTTEIISKEKPIKFFTTGTYLLKRIPH